MNFINVRLLVADAATSIKFWRDTVGLRMTYGDEAMGYAYFETESAGIELMTRQGFTDALAEAASTHALEGRPAVFVFRADDVDATYADLVKRGATVVAEPQDRPAWGARSAHISDPDGYIIEIYSKLESNNTSTN